MLIVERQKRILEHLRAASTAGLEELASMLGVSTSTVRRDVETLVQTGELERTHGGVMITGAASTEPPPSGGSASLADRMTHNVAAKESIGAAAAALVEPNMTLLMDAGSTVLYAARQIMARPIQVVTSSLIVANMFADDDEVELIVVGGSLYPRSSALVGPIATQCLEGLHADLLLCSMAGVFDDGRGGPSAYNINLDMAHVEQTMMRQAARSVMLMDASKFGRKSLVRVCPLTAVDEVITDAGIGQDWRAALGQQLRIATPAP